MAAGPSLAFPHISEKWLAFLPAHFKNPLKTNLDRSFPSPELLKLWSASHDFNCPLGSSSPFTLILLEPFVLATCSPYNFPLPWSPPLLWSNNILSLPPQLFKKLKGGTPKASTPAEKLLATDGWGGRPSRESICFGAMDPVRMLGLQWMVQHLVRAGSSNWTQWGLKRQEDTRGTCLGTRRRGRREWGQIWSRYTAYVYEIVKEWKNIFKKNLL